MNIKRIRRNKKIKNKLIEFWYKLMMPLDNLIDKYDTKKYHKIRKKAKRITDEEIIDMVIKRIVRRIKKYGKFNDEIAVCSRVKNQHDGSDLYDFIKTYKLE